MWFVFPLTLEIHLTGCVLIMLINYIYAVACWQYLSSSSKHYTFALGIWCQWIHWANSSKTKIPLQVNSRLCLYCVVIYFINSIELISLYLSCLKIILENLEKATKPEINALLHEFSFQVWFFWLSSQMWDFSSYFYVIIGFFPS